MAKKLRAVWGIDIGQCALKALRCHLSDDGEQLVADAFDYIEYPKILSQPDVDPVELIRDAFKQFLSRNSVRGDRVAMSVSGQNGLARFIKLPPVQSAKIPDIVKYEAKQQIPFPLEDVVWDYQKMVGGIEEEGFALETEVGLFAMKRDQVYRALRPFDEAGIEVDLIQLSPLTLYNFVSFDQMPNLPSADLYDADNPPESVIVLSLGTETTDLVVTNGFRVWQRSLAIGGNHFTKALTKDLKLTFAKAEHLKRNAAQAEDPKALFQAMRPVFNDLLTDIQRSISFFSNLDRRAKIGRAVVLGNAGKLPGLQRYLAQNLGIDLTRVESFRLLTGSTVVDAPAFKENVPAFGVCYGLCLQALRPARIGTNLLPQEISKERLIRAKKPWAVGAAAALLLAFSLNYFSHYRAWGAVEPSKFKNEMELAARVVADANAVKTRVDEAKANYDRTVGVGAELQRNIEGRYLWAGVTKAINLALPRDPGGPEDRPERIQERNELHIESFETERHNDLASWWNNARKWAEKEDLVPRAKPPEPVEVEVAAEGIPPTEIIADDEIEIEEAPAPADGPRGPGWVIRLRGYHLHNPLVDLENQGAAYVRKTLCKKLRQPELPIPEREIVEGGPTTWPVAKLGIAYPVLIDPPKIDTTHKITIPKAGGESILKSADQTLTEVVPKFSFVVEMCWQEKPTPELTKALADLSVPQTPFARPAVNQPRAAEVEEAVAAPAPGAAPITP